MKKILQIDIIKPSDSNFWQGKWKTNNAHWTKNDNDKLEMLRAKLNEIVDAVNELNKKN